MKALSLWQPWASAVAIGSKRIETRSWPTNYRGPIAIHAAKHLDRDELIYYGSCWSWCGALRATGKHMGDGKYLEDLLPFGAVIAIGRLVDCRPTGSFTVQELDEERHPDVVPPLINPSIDAWTERMLGDFTLGRWGWVLADMRPLPEPIPFRGRQGLFDVEVP